MAPTRINANTLSPPSCQIRIPNTIPPIATADNKAPTLSITFCPVYTTSVTRLIFKITIDSKFWVNVIAIAPNPYPKSPRIYAFLLPIKSLILLPTSMKAADTSASRAIADCTPLTVVCKSLTTDEIETFIKEVSMTSTNIAAAKRSERVVVGLLSFFSSATIIIPPLYTWVRSTPQPASSHTYHRCTYPWCTRSHCRNPYLPGTQEQRTCRLRS